MKSKTWSIKYCKCYWRCIMWLTNSGIVLSLLFRRNAPPLICIPKTGFTVGELGEQQYMFYFLNNYVLHFLNFLLHHAL